MARLFDDGSVEYLRYVGAVVAAEPMTVACWFRSDDDSINQTLISLGNDGNDGMWRLLARTTGPEVRAQKEANDGTVESADSSTGWSANVWHHACGVFASDTSRDAYIDGGSKGSDATNVADPTPDFTNIGVAERNGLLHHMSGRIAEAAIWSVALTAAEIASLADGFSPLFIRPGNLIAYWPLGGIYGVNSGNVANADYDIVGGFHMNPVNTPSIADHPGGLLYPSGALVVPPVPAPAEGGNSTNLLLLGVGGG